MAQGLGKICPDNHCRIIEDGVWDTVGWDLSEFSEKKGKNHHHEEGLDDSPKATENRLLIFNLNIPFDHEEEQVPVMTDLPQVDVLETLRGFDMDMGLL